MERVLLFKDDKCPHCQEQMQLLKGKNTSNITILDVKKLPDILKEPDGGYSVPLWVIIKPGVIDPNTLSKNVNKFGNELLTSKYGRDYLDLDTFNNNQYTFEQEVKDKIGSDNYLFAGTYAGVNSPDDIYTNSFTGNNIRMVRPGGPEDVAPMLNYNCNLLKNNNNMELGLYTDSKNPFKFGKKNIIKRNTKGTKDNKGIKGTKGTKGTKFGNMNVYPLAGGTQGETPIIERNNTKIFLENFFGKKKKTNLKAKNKLSTKLSTKLKLKPKIKNKKNVKNKCLLKEGTTLTIKRKKNGKCKIKIN